MSDESQQQAPQQAPQQVPQQAPQAINWGNLLSKIQVLLPVIIQLLTALGNAPPEIQQQVLHDALSGCTEEQAKAAKGLLQ